MPRVAQFKRVWLAGTETAIDNHVRSLRKHAPLAFADRLTGEIDPTYPVLCPPRGDGLLAGLTGGKRLTPARRDWYTLELLSQDAGLIHAHFGTDGLYYLPLMRSADLPLLATFHGHDAYRFPNLYGGLGRRLMRRVFTQATAIHTVSNHMRLHLIDLGCPGDKVTTMRVGIDLTRFEFQPPRPGGKVRIVCVAGFRPKKGLFGLIEAFRRARTERSDLDLTIVGDGPLRQEIERRIAEARLGDAVTLTGHVSLPEVADILADSHIYAQPSVTAPDGDREGVPATIMEAMARGLPVVATRHSGIPELVRDGVSGYLVDENDLDDLAERLLALADRPAMWEAMGQAGRERVERLHDLRDQTERIEAVYDRLMTGQDSAAAHAIGSFDTARAA